MKCYRLIDSRISAIDPSTNGLVPLSNQNIVYKCQIIEGRAQ